VLPVVDIAAADAGELDVDEDIVGRGEFGDWPVLELDDALLLEHEGKILRCGQYMYSRPV